MLEMDGLNGNAVPCKYEGVPGGLTRIIAGGADVPQEDRERCLAVAEPWNRHAALDIVGGDESLLNEMVQLFLVESPKLVAQMAQAVVHNDSRSLELAAHCLKGELRYLVLPQASAATEQLETAARTGKMEAAALLFGDLRTRLAPLWHDWARVPASEG